MTVGGIEDPRNWSEDRRWAYYLNSRGEMINKVGADHGQELRHREDLVVTAAVEQWRREGRSATFDLPGIQEVHRHLFKDVYPWAGEPRIVNMANYTTPTLPFTDWTQIEDAWADVTEWLEAAHHLDGRDLPDTIDGLALVYNAVNSIHTFREGNGRTQRLWLDGLANRQGLRLNWPAVAGEPNNVASAAGRRGDIGPLREMFTKITLTAAEYQQVRATRRTADLGKAGPAQRIEPDLTLTSTQVDRLKTYRNRLTNPGPPSPPPHNPTPEPPDRGPEISP